MSFKYEDDFSMSSHRTAVRSSWESLYPERSVLHWTCPRGRLNIKMSSYQYRDPHVIDKTVLRPPYFNMGILIPEKTVFILRRGPGSLPALQNIPRLEHIVESVVHGLVVGLGHRVPRVIFRPHDLGPHARQAQVKGQAETGKTVNRVVAYVA